MIPNIALVGNLSFLSCPLYEHLTDCHYQTVIIVHSPKFLPARGYTWAHTLGEAFPTGLFI